VYLPPGFEVADRAWALELVKRHPFGLLITCDAEYPSASHLPLICERREGELWAIGHVARANPQARAIAAQANATLVFEGAHAYVSASWYEQPYATVPTWNYSAVHLVGRLHECDAWHAVRALSRAVEGDGPGVWDPGRLEPAYRASQLRGIVAFELRATAVYAKAKLSQNRTGADRERVIARLAASPNQTDRECAEAMLTAYRSSADRPSSESGGRS
jgi:transcriptional regulator